MFEKVPPFTPIDKEIRIFFDSFRFIVFACVVQDFSVSLQASVSKHKLSPVSVSVFSVIVGFLMLKRHLAISGAVPRGTESDSLWLETADPHQQEEWESRAV